MPQSDRQFVDALARGLTILEVLSRSSRPMGNGDISRETGLAPSTVSRLTHTLVQLGYTRQLPGQRAYVLTPKNLALGYPVLAGISLIDRARPHLEHIARTTGETAALAIRDGLHVTFVEVIQGSNIVAVRLALGGRLPIAVSAAGIALLAAMPEQNARTMATRVRSYIAKREGDVGSFDRALDEARQTGIAIIRNAWRPGIGGVSLAVGTHDETAALTIPIATGSVTEHAMRGQLTEALRDTAGRLGSIVDQHGNDR